MRTVTKKAIQNFNASKNFVSVNTKVVVMDDVTLLLLFDNIIAYKFNDGKIKISNCGYFTNTTKERLNALDGVNIYQKNFNWYLNGEKWDGKLIEIA